MHASILYYNTKSGYTDYNRDVIVRPRERKLRPRPQVPRSKSIDKDFQKVALDSFKARMPS